MERAGIDPYKGIVFSNSFQLNNTPLPQILNSYFLILRGYSLEISSNGQIWASNKLPLCLFIFLIIEEDLNRC